MIKLLFVCHGNICRSTLAQSLMSYLVKQQGLEHEFEINSAATSREEIGNGVHYGTRAILEKQHIPCIPHTAYQMSMKDYEYYDYLIGMDGMNLKNMLRITSNDPENKVSLLLDRAIADPWYTGDFETTYQDILEGCTKLLERLTNGNN